MKGLRITEEEYAALKVGRTPKEEKRSKYGNKLIEYDGITFHSKKELVRYQDLKHQQMAGNIKSLERQKEFEIRVNDIFVCKYICDFTYYRDGQFVVEDVKSRATKTDAYKIKKNLMLAVRNISISEV